MSTREEILDQALSLPPADRAYIAQRIDDSLVQDQFASAEIAQAWMREVECRAEAYDRGEMPAEEWSVVLSRLRAQLGSATAAP